MIKLYTDKEYSDKAIEANSLHKRLIKVQEEREVPYEVYEYEKKIIQVPIYDEETGEIIGYEDKEVNDLTKPIMVEEIDPETGETILVHKHHTEYKNETVEYLEIIDEPENEVRELKVQLEKLDLKSIRSIRDGDSEYIERYRQEAEAIREQIRKLQKEEEWDKIYIRVQLSHKAINCYQLLLK